MNPRLLQVVGDLQKYRYLLLSYEGSLSKVPMMYNADDQDQIDNYWNRVFDSNLAWESLDELRQHLRAQLTDDVRMQLKLAGINYREFDNLSENYVNSPRFG